MTSTGRKLIIVGAGETAQIAYEYFTHDSPHAVIAFTVEGEYLTTRELYGLPVIPLDTLVERYPPDQFGAYVAISYNSLNRVRRRLFGLVKDMGFRCESYVSSRALVWPNVAVGENCFVFESCVVQHHAQLGNDITMWAGATIAHRSVIGNDCFIASGAVINGLTRVGERCFIGANSSIADQISIADDSVIGMGAVVTQSIEEPGRVWAGNPARRLERSALETFGVVKPPTA
ncbi:MAG TPA: acetyltransferase [Vicinamibacterales bacterium]|nr:acetyltransferase [Vicinamibacterales bacterium]